MQGTQGCHEPVTLAPKKHGRSGPFMQQGKTSIVVNLHTLAQNLPFIIHFVNDTDDTDNDTSATTWKRLIQL